MISREGLGNGDPNGVRTRVTGVRGRCPRPLDDGTIIWLGREDSNPRMSGPEPGALPLGDAPK